MSHIEMSYGTHMNESRHAIAMSSGARAFLWMSHVIYVNESSAFLWISYVAYVNESSHTCE